MEYGHNPVGPDFFGLRKNTIAKMIQDLPNAEKCTNYIWQNFEVGKTNKTVRSFLPENEPSPFSGSERPASIQNDSDDPQRNGESTPTLSSRKAGRPVHPVYEHTT
jgi:F/Y rich C-terminus